jgi:CBS domain-containing protein
LDSISKPISHSAVAGEIGLFRQEPRFFDSGKTFKELSQQRTVLQILSEKPVAIVHFVEKSSKTIEAVKLMSTHGIGAVIVKDDSSKQPLGMFTERDYISRLVLVGRSSKETPISEVMSQNVVIAEPHFTLSECSAMMIRKQIRHLPVASDIGDSIDQDSRIVGMISATDIIQEFNDCAAESSDISTLEVTVSEALGTLTRKSSKDCSVSVNDTVFKGLEMMKKFNSGGVFVHNNNILAGVFTERDYLHKIILKNRSSKDTKMGEVMDTKVATVTPNTLVRNVIPIAAQNKVIPVVSPSKMETLGLISTINVIDFLYSMK